MAKETFTRQEVEELCTRLLYNTTDADDLGPDGMEKELARVIGQPLLQHESLVYAQFDWREYPIGSMRLGGASWYGRETTGILPKSFLDWLQSSNPKMTHIEGKRRIQFPFKNIQVAKSSANVIVQWHFDGKIHLPHELRDVYRAFRDARL